MEQIEQALYLLLTVREDQRPWAVSELDREIGDSAGVIDALAHLNGAGLIHRCGEYVWASRAALHANEVAL